MSTILKKDKRPITHSEKLILENEIKVYGLLSILVQAVFYVLLLCGLSVLFGFGFMALIKMVSETLTDFLGNKLIYFFMFFGMFIAVYIVKENLKHSKRIKQRILNDLSSGEVEDNVYEVLRFFRIKVKDISNGLFYGIEVASNKVLFIEHGFLSYLGEKEMNIKNKLIVSKSIESDLIVSIKSLGKNIEADIEVSIDNIHDYWFLECYENGDIYNESYDQLKQELFSSCKLCKEQ
ncbi:MAG TPA: hypothetical protein PKC21_02280 [Oligoflexia bacterium]|nr:hypothetical protein [Oligoflexia bacterium]HMR24158.1 hypothetical protein [Oligoflexia bacterium]